MNRILTTLTLGLSVTISPHALHAQALEEVIVTAQKREQSLQDVPISVSAISAETIEANIVRDIFDLRATVPSLEMRTVDPPSQGASFALRGLGTSVFNMGLEPAVATFVDGVYRSRSGLLAANNLLDLERVEVLKGPQGTLFGKNSSAGVVHFITKKPEFDELSGFAEVSYDEWDQVNLAGVVNVPIASNAAARFSGNFQNGDGWLTDLNTGDEVNDRDRFSLRGQLLWEPQENLSIRIIADYAEVDEQCCWPVRLVNDPNTGAVNAGPAAAINSQIVDPADPEALEVAMNIPLQYEAEDFGISGEINWEFGGVTVTSVTAYRDFEDTNVKDNDFTGVDILLNTDTLPKVSLVSQELRVAGQLENLGFIQSVDWVVGMFYSHEEIRRTREFVWGSQIGLFPFGATPGRAFFHEFEQEGDTLAGFFHLTLNITDQLTVTGGFRYTNDEKEASMVSDHPLTSFFGGPNSFPLAVVYDYEAEVDVSEPTGTASIQYNWTDDIMTFATYSRGFKAGGISLARDAAGEQFRFTPFGPVGPLPMVDPTFDPEFADHYEVGLKSTLFNDRVRFNAAAWITQFEDLQQQVLRPDGSFGVINVEGAESQGVEVESTIRASDTLTFVASVQWADVTFDDGVGVISPGGANLDGQNLPFTSEWTGSVQAMFDSPIPWASGWDFFANGNLFFRTKQVMDASAQRYQSGYPLLNLRAGVRSQNNRWEASIWCRNCADERYHVSDFAIPFDGALFFPATRWGHLGTPRFVGGTIRYSF